MKRWPVSLDNPQGRAVGEVPAPPVASSSERRTMIVAAVTAAAMGIEVLAGWWFNSMALLADGWHMGTHAAAIGLSALAYRLSRHYHDDPRFAFGPWKIEVLAGFTSAIALLAAAAAMVAASVERLLQPQDIRYTEAIVVAVAGLVINLISMAVLGPSHDHGPGSTHGHGHGHGQAHGDGHALAAGHGHGPGHAPQPTSAPARHGHDDLNLRSAYLHVVADAATSALAIVALVAGLLWGLNWLDPVMGLVGAAMVARWSWSLVRDTARALLDCEMDQPFAAELSTAIRQQAPWSSQVEVLQLRVWRIGSARFAAALTLRSRAPWVGAAAVRNYLARYPQLAQLTVEVVS